MGEVRAELLFCLLEMQIVLKRSIIYANCAPAQPSSKFSHKKVT